jgi:O-antigen/teichoic acid export membrane protein
VVLARLLTPADLGRFSLALALVSAAGGMAGLGLPMLAARRIAGARSRGDHEGAAATARSSLRLAAAAGTAVTLLLALLSPWVARAFGDPGLAAPLALLAPVACALALGLAALGVARGHHDVAARALLRDGGGGALRLLAVVLALGLLTGASGRLAAAGAGYALGALVADAAFVAYVWRRGWLPLRGARDPAVRRELPPYLALEGLAQAGQWMDLWLLGLLAPPAIVGTYAAARGVGRLLEMVAEAAGHRYLPIAAAAWEEGGAAALAIVHRRARRLVLALVTPGVVLCLVAPAPLLAFAFGRGYEAGAGALRLLAGGVLLAALAGYGERTAVAAAFPGEASRARLLGVVTTSVLCAVTVPSWGAAGAALGWAGGLAAQRWLLAWRLARLTTSPAAPEA